MTKAQIAPYGSWKSPITSDLIVSESVGLSEPTFDGEIYWLELRPKEDGRLVLVKRTLDGEVEDMTPKPFNVRTRVHEYGGGAYIVSKGSVYFSNFSDQRITRLDPGGFPYPITPEASFRYADYTVDSDRDLLFCVREDHKGPGEAVNSLVKIACQGDMKGGEVLVSGNDFYSSPRLSPDGSKLAWLTWNHPNMPWDGTELWVGEVNSDGTLGHTEHVAGSKAESIFQPEWSPDGVLYFISDRTGWWNIYRLRADHIEALYPMDAEFGRPQWLFSMTTFAFESAESAVCIYSQGGASHLAKINTTTLNLEEIKTPFTSIQNLKVSSGKAMFVAGSSIESESIVLLDLATEQCEILRRSNAITVDPGYISIPKAIEFPTEKGLTAHAFYYAPYNRDCTAPKNEKPPVLVLSHGGPTAATSAILSFRIQYWTSRGFAVVDVNYGGSSGYGREFRERLKNQWGIVDVEDCINATQYLIERGEVDGDRMTIAGGSAGGYTTLCALTFRDVFSAGASHFGVADLATLTKDTHKFESRYLDGLVGPYPDEQELYVERSPIHHVDLLSCPLILFQGLEDEVVPPEQAQKMFEAVRDKGLPVSYLPFEEEQHGFRKAENIKRALDAEFYFYSKIFGFELAEQIEPVVIENL